MSRTHSRFKYTFIFLLLSFLTTGTLSAQSNTNPCYLLIESSGNYEPETVQALSSALIRQFIENVEPVPAAGIDTDACVYRISVIDETAGVEVFMSGRAGNSIGESQLRGKAGLKEALLKAIHRAGNTDQKEAVCANYRELIKDECSATPKAVLPEPEIEVEKKSQLEEEPVEENPVVIEEPAATGEWDLNNKAFFTFGLGGYGFDRDDSARWENSSNNQPGMMNGSYLTIRIDNMINEHFALGVEYMGIQAERAFYDSDFDYREDTVNITALLVDVSVMFPLDSKNYYYIGGEFGLGPMNYVYEVNLNGMSWQKYDASGLATKAGAFLDWGQDRWGMRLGIAAVSAELGSFTNTETGQEYPSSTADASGTAFYLAARFAW